MLRAAPEPVLCNVSVNVNGCPGMGSAGSVVNDSITNWGWPALGAGVGVIARTLTPTVSVWLYGKPVPSA